MHNVLKEFCRFYETLDQNNLSQLNNIYSQDIRFCDPVHCIDGMQALTDYFENLMQSIEHCRFDIHQVIAQDQKAFVRWTMNFQHPKLNKGKSIAVKGVSYLKFDSLITYHQDYFDLGEMIYERLPLLGTMIRYVKGQLKDSR